MKAIIVNRNTLRIECTVKPWATPASYADDSEYRKGIPCVMDIEVAELGDFDLTTLPDIVFQLFAAKVVLLYQPLYRREAQDKQDVEEYRQAYNKLKKELAEVQKHKLAGVKQQGVKAPKQSAEDRKARAITNTMDTFVQAYPEEVSRDFASVYARLTEAEVASEVKEIGIEIATAWEQARNKKNKK